MAEFNALAGKQAPPPRSMPSEPARPFNSKPDPAGNGQGSFYGDMKRMPPQPIRPEQRLASEPKRR